MSDQPRLTPTFHGFINDTTDALILFSACLEGVVNHVPRRPHDRERQTLITSGSVFIYEEHASGIKRWTDGISWSPSRILDNFLIYRELQRPFPPGEKKRALKRRRTGHGVQKPVADNPTGTQAQDIERSLVGSLTDSYDFKESGLVKKTISINYRGVPHHLVSYYDVKDVKFLPVPSSYPDFVNVRIRPELYLNQNFRTPVPGMPLILHQQLQAPNDPNVTSAAVGHGLYLPVSVTPPAPTITPEQAAYTQALAADMAVTTADPTYTTAGWLPSLYVATDVPVHGDPQGHNLQQQYQMQQHNELQHHNHAQFQQQQMQQQQLQQQHMQQQQLLNMHHQQLQPSPVQHNHQLQPSPLHHHQFLSSPLSHELPVPETLQRRRRHLPALYDRPQPQQPQPQHLFQSQQRHDEHRDGYQSLLMQHNQNDLSLGGDQSNTANAAQYTAEEWSSWFEHAPI